MDKLNMKCALSFLMILFFVRLVSAQTTAFTYQGRLTDASVSQPPNGTYSMKFRLYGSGAGNDQIGSEQSAMINVNNGIFTAALNFGTGAFDGNPRWLEIQVSNTTLAPRQLITSSPYAVRTLSAVSADSLSGACIECVTDAKIGAVDGAKVTGTVANATIATTATNNVLKSGDTMTGTLTLPSNGLAVGTNQIIASGGNIGIGTATVAEKLQVGGNIAIPSANNYLYNTPKTRYLTIGAAAFISANPAVYQARIDDGFSSSNINGLNSLWATGGTAGNAAYFIAPLQLPDGAVITGLSGKLVKNGGSLQSVVELYRSDSSGYSSNSAQLIAAATTTTSGGIVWSVSTGSINSSFNTVNNQNYYYFIRYSGEQNTQNLRFLSATITYQVSKID